MLRKDGVGRAKAVVADTVFADEDTPQERKLIVKLDLLIVPYAFLAYWTKYIDQANLSE